MDWHEIIEEVKPHVVRITTPDSCGTGFFVTQSRERFGIATASHVIEDAFKKRQPIKIHHKNLQEPIALTPNNRWISTHKELDSAMIEGEWNDAMREALPDTPPKSLDHGLGVFPGGAVGWLGFPWGMEDGPFFFSGHISLTTESIRRRKYFIDGVGIKGVSGGPAFSDFDSGIHILGSVTAYHSGKGEITGLMVADDCSHWQAAYPPEPR